MHWRLSILSSTAVLLLAPAPLDLDVGIPPGSPTSWGQRFPVITPGRPLFPMTQSKPTAKLPGKGSGKVAEASKNTGTVVHPKTVEMDVRISTSFGVIRILTWDLEGHLPWVSRRPTASSNPVTGRSSKKGGGPPLPFVNDGLYWANMATLLRLMLHPQLVSEREVIAHLVEVGDPVLAVVGTARSEASLAPACKKVTKMVLAARHDPTPRPGSTPRATMLKRFLAEELVSGYPFDPEAGFGRRFFWLADEIEPLLADYIGHEDSLLRRNATAALGHFRTDSAMQTLATLVPTTEDPVVLMRALSALGAYRSLRRRGGLLERLDKTKDPIEQVALVVAVGRSGVREAVPKLLELGKRNDPDLIQAVIAALARIRPPGNAKVQEFARRMATAGRKSPRRFRARFRGGPEADNADSESARGEIIEQLALILQVRVDPRSGDAAARLLALLPEKVRAGGGGRGGTRRRQADYPNNALRGVHPPVRLLFLETLRGLGEKGSAALQLIAKDRSVEPALRGQALSQMPWHDRGTLVGSIMNDKAEPVEMKIYAFEVLANDGHDRLAKIGHGLIEECGEAGGGTGTPEQRYLWLQALRALGRRHLLKTGELLPLIKHPEVSIVSREAIHGRIRDLVQTLVNEVVVGAKRKAVRARIDQLLDLAIDNGINKRITASNREEAHLRIEERLAGLKGHKANRRYRNLVQTEVQRYVLGFKMGFTLEEKTRFKPVVLLDEEILFALGRTRSKEAAAAIAEFLAERPDNPLRPQACLALGMTRQQPFARSLVPILQESDGYTRFCAYESLRHLTAEDFWADWMYGTAIEHATAAKQYETWAKKNR